MKQLAELTFGIVYGAGIIITAFGMWIYENRNFSEFKRMK